MDKLYLLLMLSTTLLSGTIFEFSTSTDTYKQTTLNSGVHLDILRAYPSIEYVDDTLISITIGVGTGTFITQYYDISRDLFSELYDSPIAVGYGNVVYMEWLNSSLRLVTTNIFDNLAFYKEFELDFAPTAIPTNVVIRAEFIDETTLSIIYLHGENYEEKSLILNLGGAI